MSETPTPAEGLATQAADEHVVVDSAESEAQPGATPEELPSSGDDATQDAAGEKDEAQADPAEKVTASAVTVR